MTTKTIIPLVRALRALSAACIIAALIGTFILPSPASAQFQTPANCTQRLGPWQLMAPAPAGHIEGGAATVNNRLYIFSGFATAGVLIPSSRVDVYHLATNTWESSVMPFGPTPFSSSHIQAAADGQYVWFAGGFVGPSGGPPTDEVWRYDTLTDTWTPGPPLPAPRASGGLAVEGRNLHFIGGLPADRQTDQADHWVLDLDNPVAWVNAAPFNRPRNHFQAVTINGIIYAVGGQTGHDGPLDDVPWVDAYDPVTDTWQQVADLPVRRSHVEPATLVINERILIVGGRSWGLPSPVNMVTQYNPQTDTWEDLDPLPVPLIGMSGAYIGNYVVVTTGGTAYDTPQLNTWVAEVITDCVVQTPIALPGAASPNPPASSNWQPTSDYMLSASGALADDAIGQTGDRIVWRIAVTNSNGSPDSVTINSVLDDSLRIAGVSLNQGAYTLNGNSLQVDVAGLSAGGTFTFTVETVLLRQSPTGLVSLQASLREDGQSTTATVRILPPVSQLPATGESQPANQLLRLALMLAASSLVGLAGGTALRMRRAANL